MWRTGQRMLRGLGHPPPLVAALFTTHAATATEGSALLRQLQQHRRGREATDLFHRMLREGRAGPQDVGVMVQGTHPERVMGLMHVALAEGIPLTPELLHVAMCRAQRAGPTRPMDLALLAVRTAGIYPSEATLGAMLQADSGFVDDFLQALGTVEGVTVPASAYHAALRAAIGCSPQQALALARRMQAEGMALDQPTTLRLVDALATSAPALLAEALPLAHQIDPLAGSQACSTALAGLVKRGQWGPANQLLGHMTISGMPASDHTVQQLARRMARAGDPTGVVGALEHAVGCGLKGALDPATLVAGAEALARAGQTDTLDTLLRRVKGLGVETTAQMYAPIVWGAAARDSTDAVDALLKSIEGHGVSLGGLGVAALATAHARAGHMDTASQLLGDAVDQDMALPPRAFVGVLDQLRPQHLPTAERVLELAHRAQTAQGQEGGSSQALYVAALGVFGRCQAAGHVDRVVQAMRSAKVPLTAPLAVAMIEAYAGSGQPSRVTDLYRRLAGRSWPAGGGGAVHGAAAQAFALLLQPSAMDAATAAALDAGAELGGAWPTHVLAAFRDAGSVQNALRLLDGLERAKAARPEHYESVIAGLARLGKIDEARQLLSRAAERGVEAGGELYAGLLGAYGQAGELGRMEELFVLMQRGGITPTLGVYNGMIAAYGREGDTAKVRGMLGAMRGDGLAPDTATYTATIGAYATALDFGSLRRLYGALAARPGALEPPILLAFYRAFSTGGEPGDMERVLGELEAHGSDKHVVGVLVGHHVRAGAVDRVVAVMAQAHEAGTVLDPGTYDQAIPALIQGGSHRAALDLYRAMPSAPTPATMEAVLGCSVEARDMAVACSVLAAIGNQPTACSPPPALLLRAHVLANHHKDAYHIWKADSSVAQSASPDTLSLLARGLANSNRLADAQEVLDALRGRQTPLPLDAMEAQARVCAAAGDVPGVDSALAALRAGGRGTLGKSTFRAVAELYGGRGPGSGLEELLEGWAVDDAAPGNVAYVVAQAAVQGGHVAALRRIMEWARAKTGLAQPLRPQQYTRLLLAPGLLQQPPALRQAMHALGLHEATPPAPPAATTSHHQPDTESPPGLEQPASAVLWAGLHTRGQARDLGHSLVAALLQADCPATAVGLTQHMAQSGMALAPQLQLHVFGAMATGALWPQAHWLATTLTVPASSFRPNVDAIVTAVAAGCPPPLQARVVHHVLHLGTAATAHHMALKMLACSNDWPGVFQHMLGPPTSSAMAGPLVACVRTSSWLAVEGGVAAMQARAIPHTPTSYRCLLAARSSLGDVDGTRRLIGQLQADSSIENQSGAPALVYGVLKACARLGLYDDVIAAYQHYRQRPIGERLNQRPETVIEALAKLGRWEDLWRLYKNPDLGPVSRAGYLAMVEGLVAGRQGGRLRVVAEDLAASTVNRKGLVMRLAWEGFGALRMAREMHWAHEILSKTVAPPREDLLRMLRACGRHGTAEIVLKILKEMESRGFGLDAEALNLGVAGLVRAGDVVSARTLTEKIVGRKLGPHDSAVRAVVKGLVGEGQTTEAVEFVQGVRDLGGHVGVGTYRRLVVASRNENSGVDGEVVKRIIGWFDQARRDSGVERSGEEGGEK